jgi:hypothetical protein
LKIDLYTKTVLTGILGCLLWLCGMHTPIATPVQAQLGPTSVIIAGYSSAGSTHGLDSGLPVRSVGVGNASTAPLPLTGSPAPAAAAVKLMSWNGNGRLMLPWEAVCNVVSQLASRPSQRDPKYLIEDG